MSDRRAYYVEYWQLNKERIHARQRRYRQENADKIRERNRAYYNTHPEVCHAILKRANHKRRVNKAGNGGSFTFDEEMELFAWQRGDCHYCGEFLYVAMPYHVDHKIPISRGGSNNIDNIALTCPSCNRRKHAKTELEFLQELAT
jgi:5-methylcytosine-specific restriction endonuclease McrA